MYVQCEMQMCVCACARELQSPEDVSVTVASALRQDSSVSGGFFP